MVAPYLPSLLVRSLLFPDISNTRSSIRNRLGRPAMFLVGGQFVSSVLCSPMNPQKVGPFAPGAPLSQGELASYAKLCQGWIFCRH